MVVGLEEVVAKLQEAPETEQIASEIGGPFILSLFNSMKNHLGKFYSPSTATMLSVFGNLPHNPQNNRTR